MSDMRLHAASPPPTTVMPVLQGVSLDVAFADDVTFRSPAADYHGPPDVVHVLQTIAEVVEEITETSVVEDGRWRTRIVSGRLHDSAVQGVLRECCDQAGRIAEVELYLRPYAALRAGIADVRARLQRHALSSSADERPAAP